MAQAQARAVAAMPLIGMGDFGARLAGAGGSAAGANATAALFGQGYGLQPSYGGNSFTLGLPGAGSGSPPRYNPFLSGITGFADRAGRGTTDPGAAPRGAERFTAFVDRAAQAWDAALGGSPTHTPPHLAGAGFGNRYGSPSYSGNPFVLGLLGGQSARDAAAAKADINATQALFGTGYGWPSRSDPTTRAETARLAAEWSGGLFGSGRATTAWPPRGRGSGVTDAATSSFGTRYPPWRFDMAQNPYLSGRLGADLGLGGLGAGRETAGWPPRGRGPAGFAARDARGGIWPSLSGPPDGATLSAGTEGWGRETTAWPPRGRGGAGMAESPWLGVPPSLAASGYGPYAGLFNYPNRWLDRPRSKLPNSTLPEPGAVFREEIAKLENPGFETIQELYSKRYGYDPDAAENEGKGQPGVYQITKTQKQQIGAMDESGNWNPDYYPGISSRKDYLDNRFAQERIFHDVMRDYDDQLMCKGAYDFLGENIVGLKDAITVTDAGLLAAAHRQGPEKVRQYLQRQQDNGWNTRKWINLMDWVAPSDAAKFRSIETRLRLLQNVPYN